MAHPGGERPYILASMAVLLGEDPYRFAGHGVIARLLRRHLAGILQCSEGFVPIADGKEGTGGVDVVMSPPGTRKRWRQSQSTCPFCSLCGVLEFDLGGDVVYGDIRWAKCQMVMDVVSFVGDLLSEPGRFGQVVFGGLLVSGTGGERYFPQAQATQ